MTANQQDRLSRLAEGTDDEAWEKQILSDLQQSWDCGECLGVEAYLDAIPRLVTHRRVVALLFYAEVQARKIRHETVFLAEYEARFPDWSIELRRLFDIHDVGDAVPDPSCRANGSAMEAPAPSHGSEARVNRRFAKQRIVAKGGLGQIYLAHDQELSRDVALKEILPMFSNSQAHRRRFLFEAKITAQLEHPGIMPIYGIGLDEDGQLFYAMKYIHGKDLRHAIHNHHCSINRSSLTSDDELTDGAFVTPQIDRRPLTLRLLLARFVTVCHTIQFAHERGVIHRDLKPGNVLLGSHGETLVLDWGLAKQYRDERDEARSASDELTMGVDTTVLDRATRIGTTLGTAAYMSPEQAAGQWHAVGPLTDVYALGATLYEILTGFPPIRLSVNEQQLSLDSKYRRMLARAINSEITRPRHLKPKIAISLEAICLKALAQRPENRYASAQELGEDVQHWLDDEPVNASRESVGEFVRRIGRRHRLALVGSVAMLLVGIMASIAFALYWHL